MIHMFAIHYCGHSAEEVWVLSLLSLAEPDEECRKWSSVSILSTMKW